jgi:hypothetical protein
MRRFGLRHRTAALLATFVALAVPAAAAATLWVGNGEGESGFRVTGGKMLPPKGHKYIYAPSNFKCNSANLAVRATSIPVSGGQINFVGQAHIDWFRFPKAYGKLTWKGTLKKGIIRFQTTKTPRYTSTGVHLVSKACDTGKLHYTVRPAP